MGPGTSPFFFSVIQVSSLSKEYGRNLILMCLSRLEKILLIEVALVFLFLVYLLLHAYEAMEKVSCFKYIIFRRRSFSFKDVS